jgi:hypothetical protein
LDMLRQFLILRLISVMRLEQNSQIMIFYIQIHFGILQLHRGGEIKEKWH